MTRKKSNLWLHKAKATRQHKDRHYPSVAWSEALMNVMFIKSPAKESNLTGKHNITPLKDRTETKKIKCSLDSREHAIAISRCRR
jgi:hypothetical protein